TPHAVPRCAAHRPFAAADVRNTCSLERLSSGALGSPTGERTVMSPILLFRVNPFIWLDPFVQALVRSIYLSERFRRIPDGSPAASGPCWRLILTKPTGIVVLWNHREKGRKLVHLGGMNLGGGCR